MTRRYFGKYRGTVVSNIDPLMSGRLQVEVPDLGRQEPVGWAMPCVPIAGDRHGMLSLPATGSDVWVEFEQGNPAYPIWVGCFWGLGATVPDAAVPPGTAIILLRTPGQNGLRISDMPGPSGGLVLSTGDGAMISVSAAGIAIRNGKGASIELVGPSVIINSGALAVD